MSDHCSAGECAFSGTGSHHHQNEGTSGATTTGVKRSTLTKKNLPKVAGHSSTVSSVESHVRAQQHLLEEGPYSPVPEMSPEEMNPEKDEEAEERPEPRVE
jgi:hypothetical protein